MSVRNDQELPRSQADASDDGHTWTDQGPLEVQEAIESIVGHLMGLRQSTAYSQGPLRLSSRESMVERVI